jgi:hypothetical protein
MPGLHPDQDIANQPGVLTDIELVRWFLVEVRGFTAVHIARMQNVSEGAVRLSVREARRKISKAKEAS